MKFMNRRFAVFLALATLLPAHGKKWTSKWPWDKAEEIDTMKSSF